MSRLVSCDWEGCETVRVWMPPNAPVDMPWAQEGWLALWQEGYPFSAVKARAPLDLCPLHARPFTEALSREVGESVAAALR